MCLQECGMQPRQSCCRTDIVRYDKNEVQHCQMSLLPSFEPIIDYTSQHDFAVKQKIGCSNGNRCPESENDVSFFTSRLVVAQFCYFSVYSRKMCEFCLVHSQKTPSRCAIRTVRRKYGCRQMLFMLGSHSFSRLPIRCA